MEQFKVVAIILILLFAIAIIVYATMELHIRNMTSRMNRYDEEDQQEHKMSVSFDNTSYKLDDYNGNCNPKSNDLSNPNKMDLNLNIRYDPATNTVDLNIWSIAIFMWRIIRRKMVSARNDRALTAVLLLIQKVMMSVSPPANSKT